ncbi:unnamed protein product [Cochlearia groenlandica]
MIRRAYQQGVLYLAEPLDACSSLPNTVPTKKGSIVSPPYVLIIRGGCSFEVKVRNAQKAGYKAAIVYDYQYYGPLVSMAGSPTGVHIYATYVSKETGEILKENVGRTDMELWFTPNYKTTTWSIMAVVVIFIVALSAMLATWFFVRRQRIRRRRRQSDESRPLSKEAISTLPTTIFDRASDERSTSVKCVICFTDYKKGETLRILPCNHNFHAKHIDRWLSRRRSLCPICRRNVRTFMIENQPTEHTPLLSPGSTSSTSSSSSFILSSSSTTSSQSSDDLQIDILEETPSPSTTRVLNKSYRRSMSIPISQSSEDLINAISQRSRNSPQQGFRHSSLDSRYNMYALSPRDASSSSDDGLLSPSEHLPEKFD